MPEFRLESVDWSSVSLLHGEHLRSETQYLEQLSRWSLTRGRAWGVVSLSDGGLRVEGSESDYEVTLSKCTAITRGGYIVNVENNGAVKPLKGSTDQHSGSIVPIFLGVSLTKPPVEMAPSQSASLLECRSLAWQYR